MMVKIMASKRPRFKSVIRYILEKSDNSFPVLYNHISATKDKQTLSDEFVENLKFKPKRKKICYNHIILSFHEKDSKHLAENKNVMPDLVHKFMSLFGIEQFKSIAAVHTDKQHYHYHILTASNSEFETLRISRPDLMEAREKLEQYQLDNYPSLSNSVAYLQEKNKGLLKDYAVQKIAPKKTLAEQEIKRRKGIIHKDKIRQRLTEVAKGSMTQSEFINSIQEDETIALYEYRGKIQGVQDMVNGKKYRLKNLYGTKDIGFILRLIKSEIHRSKEAKKRNEQKQDRGL